jgi:4-nitrophenyl phosphatase
MGALGNIKGLLIDIDGTLVRGKQPLPGGKELFAFLKEKAVRVCVTSNNSVTSPDQIRQSFLRIGVSLTENEIVTSATAVYHYLCRHYPQGGTAYVIGQPGLVQAVSRARFRLLTDANQKADVVVVGGDPQLTYQKIKDASLHIQRGTPYLGTNPDVSYPAEEGLLPETGTTLAALQAATGVEALVIGKPEKYLFEAALDQLQLPPAQAAMLGDRLDTDVIGAQRAGMLSILVETGIDNSASAQAKQIFPDLIVKDLPDLIQRWQSG